MKHVRLELKVHTLFILVYAAALVAMTGGYEKYENVQTEMEVQEPPETATLKVLQLDEELIKNTGDKVTEELQEGHAEIPRKKVGETKGERADIVMLSTKSLPTIPNMQDDTAVEQDNKSEIFNSTYPIELNEEDEYILAKIAMAEAESEDTEGKALVMLVVLNRILSKEFPDTVEEVVKQKIGRCYQFTPIKDGRYKKVEPNDDCWDALQMVYDGYNDSQGAIYFHSGDSRWHERNLKLLFRRGNHKFYK